MLFLEMKDCKIYAFNPVLNTQQNNNMSSAATTSTSAPARAAGAASSATKVRKPKESLASLKIKEREYNQEVALYTEQLASTKVEVALKNGEYLQAQQLLENAQKQERDAAGKYANAYVHQSIVSKKINVMEKKEEIDQAEKQEKKDLALAKKNMPKGIYSEAILTEMVARCPPEIIAIIGEYLPVEVMNNLLSFDLYRKIHNIGVADMIRGFRRSICGRREYLTLVSREVARGHFKTIRGVVQPKENSVRSGWWLDLDQGIVEVKMDIYDIINNAKVINPMYANKMLKTVAVLNKNKKLLKRNFASRNMPELTEFDLPAKYL